MDSVKRRRLRNLLLIDAALLAAVGIFALLAHYGIAIPCLFRKLTGLLCPGCGNSRAAIALLGLDFQTAWQCNRLCFAEFGYLAWVYCVASRRYWKDGRFSYEPPCVIVDVLLLVAVIVWGVLRNL